MKTLTVNMKKKSFYSIKEATFLAWNNYFENHKGMNVIHMVILIIDVRRIIGRPALMDGTITRRLRELRAEGKINYRCIDSELSIYKKL